MRLFQPIEPRPQSDIKIGMTIYTPRYGTVQINALYTSEAEAKKAGYLFQTDYESNRTFDIVEGVHNVLGLLNGPCATIPSEYAAVVAVDCIPETAAKLQAEYHKANSRGRA